MFLELTPARRYAIVGLAGVADASGKRIAFFCRFEAGPGGKCAAAKTLEGNFGSEKDLSPTANLYNTGVKAAPRRRSPLARMEHAVEATLTVNGTAVTRRIAPRACISSTFCGMNWG